MSALQSLRIALGQINPAVGDLAGNAALILQQAEHAHKAQADILLLPELALTGYPPEDLLLRPSFVGEQTRGLETICAELGQCCPGLHVIVGHVLAEGTRLFNAASVLRDGQCIATYCKQRLPDYGVFDETRYFSAGHEPLVIDCKGLKLGVLICEDVWATADEASPANTCKNLGAQALLVLNASPWHMGKQHEREKTIAQAAQGLPVVYVNLVGGQDELVFDGASMVVDHKGQVAMLASAFQPELGVVNLYGTPGQAALTVEKLAVNPWPDDEAKTYAALVMALRDYVRKTGFTSVLLGLSGGLDSALVLALAVDALGADAVRTVMMPSPHTAQISLDDARQMAQNLGVRHSEIPIAPLTQAFDAALAPLFGKRSTDVTEENIQARVRGVLLMAASNKFGSLLLTTGNKSELATGYCTLYGDMAGGFAPLKDIPKTLAYRLARWRNQQINPANPLPPIIPERILTRAPSAELRPDQTDQDSLPPYEVLDEVLMRYVEQNQSVADIIAAGFETDMIKDIVRRIHLNEYKRRQGAVGPRMTTRAFGRDWRYPIANGFQAQP